MSFNCKISIYGRKKDYIQYLFDHLLIFPTNINAERQCNFRHCDRLQNKRYVG